MAVGQRCLVIVPVSASELHARLVEAFVNNPRIFVLRDRRGDDRGLQAVEVFAVGGGALDPDLRRLVEDELRRLGVRR